MNEDKANQLMLGDTVVYSNLDYRFHTHETIRKINHLIYNIDGDVNIEDIMLYLMQNGIVVNRHNLYRNYLSLMVSAGAIREVTDEVLHTSDIKNIRRKFTVMDRVFRRMD